MITRGFNHYFFLILFLFLPLLGGCVSNPIQVRYDKVNKAYMASCKVSSKISGKEIVQALNNHIIDINDEGDFSPIGFSINCPDMDKQQKEEREKNPHDFVLNIVKDLEEKKYKKLLIYLHGGLVKREEGVKEAIKLTKAVLEDLELQNENKTYPVSIVWRSGGWESYRDQLIRVRNGEVNESLAVATAPFKLGSDLGRGLMDMPFAGGLEGNRLIKSIKNELNECHESMNVICPPEGEDFSNIPAPETIVYFFLTPLRIATSPFINGLGRPSWENMIRRTRSAFLREKPHSSNTAATDGYTTSGFEGGVYLFFKELHEHLPADVTITLIAHSMGAMLASEVIHQFPNLPYERVVFMGAAVSIRDFKNTVVPYLDKPETNFLFYNLSLLPVYDAREFSDYIGAIPSGSLLEWIDEMYTSPPTLADRTLGKWYNIKRVLPSFPDTARKKMFMRVFGKKKGQPQRHGEFNDIKTCFWRDTFWKTTDSEWEEKHFNKCSEYYKQLFY